MTERERFENWVQNETRLPFHAYWAAWLGWEARAQAKLEAQPVSGEAREKSERTKAIDALVQAEYVEGIYDAQPTPHGEPGCAEKSSL